MTTAALGTRRPSVSLGISSSLAVHLAFVVLMLVLHWMEPAKRPPLLIEMPKLILPKKGAPIIKSANTHHEKAQPASMAHLLAQAKGLAKSALPKLVVHSRAATDFKAFSLRSRSSVLSGLSKSKSAQLIQSLNTQLQEKSVRWETLSSGLEGATQSDGEDLSRISRILSAHQGEFRDCYEHALLSDAALNGRARLSISSDSVASTFNGGGSRSSQNLLCTCLSQVLHRIHFPNELKRIQLQFGLLFKSG